MDKNKLFKYMAENRDSERAVQMEAYMRNQFQFLGIPAGKRRELAKPFYRQMRQESSIDWEFLKRCWDEPYREYQYVGADYLNMKKTILTPEDVPSVKELALKKPWWDTIDSLDKVVGNIALRYPEVNETLLDWSVSNNIWLRRIAIDHQRLRKEATDRELLENIIVNNLGQTEFFINKAIGWSLRDYSKTNPDWVRAFLERYKEDLSPLSIREASKYV